MKNKILFALMLVSAVTQAQDPKAAYQNALRELKGMLTDSIPLSFKRAVFVTENAYLNGSANYEVFNSGIKFLAQRSRNIVSSTNLIYTGKDKESMKKNFAVFKLMTDTNKYQIDSTRFMITNPYSYDFDDFMGDRDWAKMFILKLMETNKGNCHSLPFLYKMICEELNTKAYLALAPNHIYIKQYSEVQGWYNTELTSAYFPIDAWIMASGYIHLSAVQNRVYMDTLSQKQSIAVCLIDLAKGFERKFPKDLNYIEQCADVALIYYPKYTNALILKAETTKKRFEEIMVKAGANSPSQILKKPEANALFEKMETQYAYIHNLGYRMMPKEMYLNWLSELKLEREKYGNKEIMNNLRSTAK